MLPRGPGYELCEILSESFDSGVINISGYSLLPHQVVSLGFFLSRSHGKWKELLLMGCHIGDYGLNIIHQYLCGDNYKASKQNIVLINLGKNDLTRASSHLIADIISHLQPNKLWLYNNNITNMRDISTAVINTSTVNALDMRINGLTAQDAVAISDMMICLEQLYISGNKFGDHGAELLSEGITNTKTLRILNIIHNNIGPSGTITIANALTINTSLEELYIFNENKFGQDEAIAIAKAITNNKTLKILSLGDDSGMHMNKESAMIIMRSLHYNNTITEVKLNCRLHSDDGIRGEVRKINKERNKCTVQALQLS